MLWIALGCAQEPIGPIELDPPDPVPSTSTGEVERVTEVFVQRRAAEVDVLLVVDDSGSMLEHHERLLASVPGIVDFWLGTGVDFRIGVVTTDPARGGALREVPGHRWVDGDTEDPVRILTELVTVGVTGGSEHGLSAVYAALSVNPDFFRPNADVQAVVVSDEDDSTPAGAIGLSEAEEWFGSVRALPATFAFSAVVPLPASPRYLALVDAFPGVAVDLLDPDYVSVFEAMVLPGPRLQREFCVGGGDDHEVEVQAPGEPAAALVPEVDFELHLGCVRLAEHAVPDQGAVVRITYVPADR